MSGFVQGWLAIARGEADWRRHFLLSIRGLIEVLALYLIVAYLVSFIGSAGQMSPLGVLIPALMLLVYPLALWLAIALTLPLLGRPAGTLDLMVPGIFALMLFTIFTGLGQIVFPPIIILGLAGIGLALGRLGAVALGRGAGVGAAFGVFVTVLLVGMPFSLYMLASLSTTPA